MNPVEQKKQAKEFAARWLNREGYEKGETSPFWQELLTDVFGESDVTKKLNLKTGCNWSIGASLMYVYPTLRF